MSFNRGQFDTACTHQCPLLSQSQRAVQLPTCQYVVDTRAPFCSNDHRLSSSHSQEPAQLYDYFEKYTFLCEMYDAHIQQIRELILNFFPFDNSVQVVDPKKGKFLLRRCQIPEMNVKKLQIGNTVNIYSKLLRIVDCVPATKRTLMSGVQSTFALIKPVSPEKHGKVLSFIIQKGFQILQMKNGKLDRDFAKDLYKAISGSNMMPIIIEYMTSGVVVGLELSAENAVRRWRSCLGATDPKQAAPGTLRHLLGEDILHNIAHGCDTEEQSQEMLRRFFGTSNGKPNIPYLATYENCACCIIKPHVLIDGNVGGIVDQICTSKNLYVSAMGIFTIRVEHALEFYEIYKGVLNEYEEMAFQLAQGRLIAMEIKCKDPSINVVCEFRKLCGPRDPELARQLYPDTIRGLYGKTIIENAVHCTDHPDEGCAEVEYFFRLLSNASSLT